MDRSFVQEITDSDNGLSVLRTIAGITSFFDLKDVTTGVSRGDKYNFLLELGCNIAKELYCIAEAQFKRKRRFAILDRVVEPILNILPKRVR